MVAFKKLPWVAVEPLDWAKQVSVDVEYKSTLRPTVAILDTGHLEHSLGSWRSNDTSTTS